MPADLLVPETEAGMIPATARGLAAASIADNTHRAYTRALARFDAWRGEQPETDQALAAYLSMLFEQGQAPASGGQVVAAVKFRARLAGQPVPVGPATARVLAGFRRQGAVRGRGQVTGIRWEQADAAAAVAANEDRSLTGLRDAALIAVMSDAMLRVSEASALNVDDVHQAEQTVTVRRAKTDQEGAGAVLHLDKPTVRRVVTWRQTAALSTGPLFRSITKGGKVRDRLTARSVRRIITARMRAVGIVGRVSGHSLRVGAAQSLERVHTISVMLSEWSSPNSSTSNSRICFLVSGGTSR